MLAERLDKAWRERRRSIGVDPLMRFSDEGLVLGAGTVLAATGRSGREISIDPREPRLQALLAAAHLRRPTAGAIAHLRKAAERWSEGQDALAAMHLALSKLDRLEQPEADAHRLFLTDGLLKGGIGAGAIIGAIEAGGPAFERLHKYDPNQPRVPAGSGRQSGEWTSGGGDSTASSDSEAEVNPSTITEVSQPIGSIYACKIATVDCIDVALADADLGQANDNGMPTADINRCREAYTACELLSMAIEDVPFLDYGGVIFPHRGVVIMRKGQLDVYHQPLSGGRTPPFSRRP